MTLKLKTADFRILTRRRALPAATQTARTLFAVGRDLLRREADGRRYRLIGIGLADLTPVESLETDFFGDGESRALAEETTADSIRARVGPQAITSARALRSRRPVQD